MSSNHRDSVAFRGHEQTTHKGFRPGKDTNCVKIVPINKTKLALRLVYLLLVLFLGILLGEVYCCLWCVRRGRLRREGEVMLDCEQRLQQPIQKLSDRESRQNPLKLNLLTGWWGPNTQKESRLFTVISKVFWDRFFWCALSEGHAVGHDGGQFSFLGSFLAVMIFMSYHHSRFFPALVYIPASRTSSRPQGPRLETHCM
jgi:hypothetical protein